MWRLNCPLQKSLLTRSAIPRSFNVRYSLLASGSVHLGLLALVSGLSLGLKTDIQPVAIEFIEAHQHSVDSVTQNQIRKIQTQKIQKSLAIVESPVVSLQKPIEDSPALAASFAASAEDIASAKDVYISKLSRALNARKHYPEISLKMRQQGRLKVRFLLERDGRILSAELIEMSNFLPLNEAAKNLISEIKKFDPIPMEVAEKQLAVTVPIEYLM